MTIVGAAVGGRELEGALARVGVEHLGIERRGGRYWVGMPADVRVATLEALVGEVGGEVVVVEVEMALGGRGSGLQAERYTLPSREGAVDLSEEARELLHEWIPEGSRFDEDTVALEIAWALIEDDEEVVAERQRSNFEDRWAEALLARLVTTGAVELRSKHRPVADIAHELQLDDDALGSPLLEALVSSIAVEEVFLDEAELLRAAHATRPPP